MTSVMRHNEVVGLKKTLQLILVIALFGGGWWGLTHIPRTPVLRLCTWSNYFPDDLLKAFTDETGVPVEMSYISNNEELFSKLKAGASGYDIIQPSDYMVGQMIHLGMLTKLVPTDLPHFKHLDPYYKDLPYDPGLSYTIPFVRGITGIIVNTEKVKLASENVGWDLLFQSPDPKHTSLLDDMREVFTGVLYWKGRDPNNPTPTDLVEARQEITRIKERIALFTSEPFPMMARGEVNIAHAFSTHGLQAHQENPLMKFYIPKEGGVIWTDNFAIPITSQKVKEAHAFIDFFLRPEIALKVIEFNGMASPNLTARKKLPFEEQRSPVTYPSPEVLMRLKFFGDLGPIRTLMARLWTEAKS